MDRHRSPIRRSALHVIDTYQREVSHRLGARCSLDVSCSHYAHDAFEHHTAAVAAVMTVARMHRCSRATRRGRPRKALRVLAATFVFALAVLMFPLLGSLGAGTTPASAATSDTGGCAATLAGSDAYAASTPDNAIVVGKDDEVVAAGEMASGPVTYNVDLEFAGVSWNVATGTSVGTESMWSDVVKIADVAKYGVGIYRVNVAATNTAGQRCTLHAYVKVDASPLSSTVGKGAAVAFAVGAAAVAVPTAMAAAATPVPKPTATEQEILDTTSAALVATCNMMTIAAVVLTVGAILRSKGVA